MSYSGGGDDNTPTKQRVAQQQGPAVGLGVYIAEQGSTKSSGDEKGVLQSWYDWAFGADEEDSPIITPEAEPEEVVNEVLNEKDFPVDPRTNLPVGALPRQRYVMPTDPLDLASLEGSTQGFNPPAVATGLEVVQALQGSDVDAKAARTRRSLEEQAQPERGIFAYEGPEAAMSEASIETNLNAEQRRGAQSALNNLGFNAGSADGIIGNRTRDAIAQYQVTLGLPPTGFLDERTQNALDTGATGRTLSEVEAEFDFIGGTQGGRALRAAEDLRYNAYSLNHQPVLRGGRKHNSGLTLGVAVDLGQQSAEELRSIGVPNPIVDKLEASGWLGLQPENIVEENDSFRRQGHAAMLERYQEQMQNGTLVTLTPEEMDTLTQTLYEEKYMPTVEDIYNSTSYSEEVPFDELSEEARAALGAEVWHYGDNLSRNAEAFARAASRNDIRGITDLYFYKERGPKVLNALGVN
jgi:peptidoglycan hydrolase-like protein with peptidoglycan-binding domain